VNVPVLANITEFGATPLFTTEELKGVGISIVLYPLSAFRAMNKAALKIYEGIREHGTQKDLINEMQTREELYDFLNYHDYEKKIRCPIQKRIKIVGGMNDGSKESQKRRSLSRC